MALGLVLHVACLMIFASIQTVKTDCVVPMDIAFVLDSSDSITEPDFTDAKSFVVSSSQLLDTTGKDIRHAVFTYAERAKKNINFDYFDRPENFLNRVNDIPKMAGSPELGRVLDDIYSDLFGPKGSARIRVFKVIVIISQVDKENKKDGILPLFKISKRFQRAGVRLIMVIVGKKTIRQHLSEFRHVMEVLPMESFAKLNDDAPKLMRNICKVLPQPVVKCLHPVDMLFLVDNSIHAGDKILDSQKSFVEQVAESFSISPTVSRLSVVTYNTRASLVIKFNDQASIEDFISKVNKLPLSRSRWKSRVDQALLASMFDVFGGIHTPRKGASKILVLLVVSGKWNLENIVFIEEISAALRRASVKIFVVEFGAGDDGDHLTSLVEKPSSYLHAGSDLSPNVTKFARLLCDEAVTNKCFSPVDMAFILNTSSSLGMNLQTTKQFFKALASSFNISPSLSRVAVITYDTNAHVYAHLEPRDIETVHRLLDEIPFNNASGTVKEDPIPYAFQLATHSVFDENSRSRDKNPKIIITLHDNSFSLYTNNGHDTPLKERGIRAFSIIIGGEPLANDKVPNTNKHRQIRVDSYTSLATILPRMSSTACQSTAPDKCFLPVNVAFLVDTTLFTAPKKSKMLQFIKNFLKQMTHYLGVTRTFSRVLIPYYSTESAVLMVDFKSERREGDLTEIIDELPYPEKEHKKYPWDRVNKVQTSGLVEALETISRRLCSKSKGGPGHIVILANGVNVVDVNDNDVRALRRTLRQGSCHCSVVSTGDDADVQSLRLFVDSNEDIHALNSIKELPLVMYSLAERICIRAAPKKSPHASRVVLALHSTRRLQTRSGTRLKNFLMTLVDNFMIGSHESHVAVITYRNRAVLRIPFDGSSSAQDLVSAILNFKDHEEPRSFTTGAIGELMQLAMQVLYEEKAKVPKIVIVVTDEIPSGVIDARAANDPKGQLRTSDVKVFAVGVRNVVREDLVPLVKRRRNVYISHSYRSLARTAAQLGSALHANTAPKKCTIAADIGFLLYTSNSMGAAIFKKIKRFMMAFVDSFTIGKNVIQLGLVAYGREAHIVFRLNEFSSMDSILKAIKKIPVEEGSGGLQRAFQLAATELFSANSGGRLGVAKLAIVITTETSHASNYVYASEVLAMSRAKAVIIGIGGSFERSSFKEVAPASRTFHIQSLDTLHSSLPKLTQRICVMGGFQKCPTPIDLVFLVDSSGSIGLLNYQKQKNFIKSIIDGQDIGKDLTSVGIIAYSHIAKVVIKLSDYSRADDLKKAVDKMEYFGKTTRMDKALWLANHKLLTTENGKRKGVPTVVVLLTDGTNTRGDDGLSLKSVSSPLQARGVKMFAVAIGRVPRKAELLTVVGNKDRILRVPSFDHLQHSTDRLSIRICKVTEPRICDVPTDILFIVDATNAISPDEFNSIKEFLKRMALSVGIGISNRFAVISFGRTATVTTEFGENSTPYEFSQALDKRLVHQGGDYRFEQAMELATGVFSNKDLAAAQMASRKICIAFVHGNRYENTDYEALEIITSFLHRDGIQTIAVGIGRTYAAGLLESSLYGKADVVLVPSFSGLLLQVDNFARKICKEDKDPKVPVQVRCEGLADIVFAMDTSTDIVYHNIQKQLTFLKRMARRLNISPKYSHSSLVVYSSFATVVTTFKDDQTLEAFDRALDKILHEFEHGPRRIDRVLQEALKIFGSQGGSRKYVPKILMLLVGGEQSTGIGAQLARQLSTMQKLFKAGVRVLAVGVGGGINIDELTATTQNPDDVIMVPSFGSLVDKTDALASSLCSYIRPARCKEHLDIAFLIDSSSSVGHENFELEKRYVSLLIGTMNIESDVARASVIAYSDKAKVHVPFSNSSFQAAAISHIPYNGHGTRIDQALMAANDQFTETAGSRPYLSRVAVLLTDGRQNKVSGYTPLEQAVKPLTEKRIKFIVIGIGKGCDPEELEQLVDHKDDMILVPGFAELLPSLYPVSLKSCQSAKTYACPLPLDITFVVGAPFGVTTWEFNRMKQFIKNVANTFIISPSNTQIGVVVLAEKESVIIYPDQYKENKAFSGAIDAIRDISGIIKMEDGLFTASGLLLERKASRREVSKVIIGITDGDANYEPVTLKGVQIISVTVDRELPKTHHVDNKKRHNILCKSYEELLWRAKDVAQKSCRLTEIPKCSRTFDIVILLDTSARPEPHEFKNVKQFLKLFASSFNIKLSDSRVGLISYSSKPKLIISLNDTQNVASIDAAIGGVLLGGGQSRLDKALDMVAVEMFVGNRRSSRVGTRVLLTVMDARLSDAIDVPALDLSVSPLIESGVNLFIVGVGGSAGTNSVLTSLLTRHPRHYYASTSYDQLPAKLRGIVSDVCLAADYPTCDVIYADIAFILDASGSVGELNFRREKEMVTRLAKTFEISRDGVRIGVVSYSSHARVDIKLTDYNSYTGLQGALGVIPYMGYQTRLDLALRVANTDIFSYNTGMRVESYRLALLFTDGKQSRVSGSITPGSAVMMLKDKGVRVIVVGIGKGVSKKELRSMVERDEDLLLVASFQEFMSAGREVRRMICQRSSPS